MELLDLVTEIERYCSAEKVDTSSTVVADLIEQMAEKGEEEL